MKGAMPMSNKPKQFFSEPGGTLTGSTHTVCDQGGKADTTFNKKIGTTMYLINVHYPTAERETVKDKILRIITNEAVHSDKAS